MNELVSPKQVARAIGVSESSLKRWCDKGLLPTVRTAGGHRRMTMSGVLAFLKTSGHQIIHPEVLGLPAICGQGPRSLERSAERLRDALIEGNEPLARQVLLDLFLAGHRIAELGDMVLCGVMRVIGDRWACGDVAVYQERHGCQILVHILNELRMIVATPDPAAPLAIGGTPEGDFYSIPTSLIELVLRENHWNAQSLGSGLPLASLAASIQERRPRLCWLSVSYLPDPETFLAEFEPLWQVARLTGTELIVGGHALTSELCGRMPPARFGKRLSELEDFARTLWPHTLWDAHPVETAGS